MTGNQTPHLTVAIRPHRTLGEHGPSQPGSPAHGQCAPFGAGVKAKPLRGWPPASLDPDPSPTHAQHRPGNRKKQSQTNPGWGLTRPHSFRDDVPPAGTRIDLHRPVRLNRQISLA
jgi:hypothetical protein